MKVGSVHQSIEHYPDPFSCSSSRKVTGQQNILSPTDHPAPPDHTDPVLPKPPSPHMTTLSPRTTLSLSPPDHACPCPHQTTLSHPEIACLCPHQTTCPFPDQTTPVPVPVPTRHHLSLSPTDHPVIPQTTLSPPDHPVPVIH
ncbi:unnamed protein product [Arctogadus glacialis]